MGTSYSHQTIRLSAGRHRGPEHGACVMELASMLAGEPFTDHPESVCPVIAGFLRSYNDHVDDARRRDLYGYAALVVGTRGDEAVERHRARTCLRWTRELAALPPMRVRLLHRLFRFQGHDVDGVYAARATATTPALHRRALGLVDELLVSGSAEARAPVASAGPSSACSRGARASGAACDSARAPRAPEPRPG